MNTTIFWEDGIAVPYPRYRCKATMRKHDEPGTTHLCKRHIDHEEDTHVCICGKWWVRVEQV